MLKWIVDRIEGRVEADETVVGRTARAEDLDMSGLDTPMEDVKEALSAPAEQWARDLEDNEEYLRFLGPKVPSEVFTQFESLKQRIHDAQK